MKLHEEWMYKAENDLESAKCLLSSSKKLFDIAVYHTQQCAEKALKAFLVFNELEIDKTHNLVTLNIRCKEFYPDFENLKTEIVFINPYATQFRYPEGDLQPSKEEAEKAVMYAEKIFLFVKKIFDEANPLKG